MKNPELYHKSVDILLDAYNSRELEHGSCTACAVGNLCGRSGVWGVRFFTATGTQLVDHQYLPLERHEYEALGIPTWCDREDLTKEKLDFVMSCADETISATGYTQGELMKIEFAFETQKIKDRENDTQYYGLCAVLDVLRDIHEVDKENHDRSHERLETIYKKFQVA